ncbi:1-acyl-sn-glycerol-3-phosphate acyltransferase [Egibacter rhizosphaerae]|uniref:1-acyl-sn-glycerol-3-phosphate acyltransferase n=1 Tax=Egibacter rhizosphaerae TaxID=1670831 RepID=A0A411YHC0_9ACTN|nr:lysophospholipid acyltransferase family protein [Egibacter rhizosphaerae]QBI20664.1 1-acyl-sn-glycerol-3-phosphate acyltransferase [Egibacter rhizosphaerae]
MASTDEELQYDSSWARRPLARVGRMIVALGLMRFLIFLHNAPRAHGRDRLKGLQGPVLVASNHASHLDTPIILQSLPRPLRGRTGVVAAADYFFKNRFTGWFVCLCFATIPIERSGISEHTREQINGMVADGWSILLFPEGTRTRDGRMGRLKHGTAAMSIQYGLPIVPVYLTGTHESHGKGSKWPTPHRVHVYFGEPIPPRTDDDYRALTTELRERLELLAAEAGRAEP